MATDRRAERPRSGGSRPPQPRSGQALDGRRLAVSRPADGISRRPVRPAAGRTSRRPEGSGPVRREPARVSPATTATTRPDAARSHGPRHPIGRHQGRLVPAWPGRRTSRAAGRCRHPGPASRRPGRAAQPAQGPGRDRRRPPGRSPASWSTRIPSSAYAHAEAARRRAARLPIVREAAAETAYAAGHYDVALSEFRALRRMTGSHDYLPVMADCERALGRPHNALKLAKEAGSDSTRPGAADRDDHRRGRRPARPRPGPRGPPDPGPGRPRAQPAAPAGPAPRPGCTTPTPTRCWPPVSRTRHDGGSPARPSSMPSGDTDAQQRVDELDGLLIDFDETTTEPEYSE